MRSGKRNRMAAIAAVLACLLGAAGCGANAQEEPAAETAPIKGAEEEAALGEEDVLEEETDMEEDFSFGDRIPMVMVDDALYLDTGRESTLTARCGMMDGEITSSVDASEKPSENGQSNFGSGYGWQYGEGDTIEILINDKWMVFKAQED